ncbi:TonB-dependent receptor [Acetobacter senegalensis]|uniref:TonB-dependent receptor n=1 Tax=Acetobacter senegalensis TaxID=446692 RepID=UPI0020A11398|nr:TonB-dependent receptor [Acetobacter senegalensis]MCP1195127.1 TonB-dependent receptor [Acetobacter senegalensis]
MMSGRCQPSGRTGLRRKQLLLCCAVFAGAEWGHINLSSRANAQSAPAVTGKVGSVKKQLPVTKHKPAPRPRSIEGAVEDLEVRTSHRNAALHTAGAVTSIGGAEIRALNLNNPKDIAGFVPGLSAVEATSGSVPIFSIRGVGLDDFNASNMSGIGMYFDGIYSPFPVFYSGQMLDIQHVDVMKGPQGFDYGRSATGGAINYESVKPTDQFGGYLTWGYSSYATNTAKGAINGALTDRITDRFAFSYRNGDGWQKDLHNGNRYGASDLLALRNMTKFELDDKTSLLLNIHYTRNYGTPNSPQNTTTDSLMGLPVGTNGVSGSNRDATRVNVGDFPVSRRENGGGAALTLRHDFSFATLVATSAVDAYSRRIYDNFDGSRLERSDYYFRDNYFVQSQDIHLTSRTASPVRWTVGLFESFDHIDGLYKHMEKDLYELPSANFTSDYRQQNVSFGVYTNNVVKVTNKFRLIFGGRYSMDQRSYFGGTVDNDGAVSGVPMANLTHISQTRYNNRFTGKVGAEYQVTPDVLLYATISNGYKPGTYYSAAVGSQQALSYVRPENLVAYEVGAKAALFNRTLTLQGALFDYEYHNRQTLVVANTLTGVAGTLGNIPRARSRGGELQARWVTPIKGLDFNAGFSYMDGIILKAPSSVRGMSLIAPISNNTVLPFSPRFSWDAVARYQWNLSKNYTMAYQVSYTWKDNQIDGLADPNGITDKISSMGMRLALRPANSKWEASVWVDNLLNKHGNTYSFSSNDNSRVEYRQTPRWIGGDLTYNF